MSRRTIPDDPLNAEMPLDRARGRPVAAGDFFVRSHFETPDIAPDVWRLAVGGAVARPLSLDLDALRAMPRREIAMTLECAGNGRSFLSPATPGAQWGFGAVSTATFGGVSLAEAIARAAPAADTVEWLCRGADSGPLEGAARVPFERALPAAVTADPDVLLCTTMNGAPLACEHGAPVRLVVPGWYGVASVKWLAALEARTSPFRGAFQTDRYVYRGGAAWPEGTPVTRMRVRALIAAPAEGARVPAGTLEVAGSAWSGAGPIAAVEVSADGGATWVAAELGPPLSRHAATPWRARIAAAPGATLLLAARARDATGATQPDRMPWNALGYGNNAVQRVRVRVTED
jgi:DMSO/TMAO reductase YedYZ molybdopterin-dependent catalytic subunit